MSEIIMGQVRFLMSVPVYAVFFLYNNGEIRWYGVLAVFLGGLLYEMGISRMLARFGRRYLERPRRKIICLLSKARRYFSVRKMLRKVKYDLCRKNNCKNLANSIL